MEGVVDIKFYFAISNNLYFGGVLSNLCELRFVDSTEISLLGYCAFTGGYSNRLVEIIIARPGLYSRDLLTHNDQNLVLTTLVHEIAHAYPVDIYSCCFEEHDECFRSYDPHIVWKEGHG